MLKLIEKAKKYQFVFSELVKRDFTKKYKRTVLGILWSVLGPLATLTVMALVFTQFFGRNTEHYIVYLFCGNLIFGFFRESTSNGMHSLAENAGIFSKINVPKYLFLFSKNVSSLINFSINLVILFIFVLIDGLGLHLIYITLIYPILCMLLFNIGVGLVLSALFLMFKDLKYLYDIFISLLMYMSAIFYSVSAYPENVQWLFNLNPVYVYISYFREVIILGTIPDLLTHVLAIGYAVIAALIGCIIYKTQNYKFLYYI